MEWLYYLLEANLYLLLFYGFYLLFLQHETFYNNNRYYLMLSSITAFILPILQLGFLNPAPIVNNVLFPPPILYTEEQLSKISLSAVQDKIDFTSYLYPLYLFVALCFAIKLAFNISKIIRLWLKAKKQTNGKVTLIELSDEASAFSFFNLLFIHPHLAEKQTVLKHEMVHIKQKHSLDILFFEILQIVCWFNPFIYFIKKDIKLLHEYIADEQSTNADMQKHEYAMFLIENSFGVTPTQLTNQIFNQSILKRRINMLNKKRTAGWARLRLLLVLPLTGAMLCTSTMAFKNKDYGYVNLLSNINSLQDITKKMRTPLPPPKVDQVKFQPPIVKNDRFTPIYAKDKTTRIPILSEKRLILINGKAVENLTTFYGVYDADNVRYRMKDNAEAKYGDKGKNGAVEITGKNIKYYTKLTYPTPPPVEPPPPGYKTKQDQIKFPPPIVKPDSVNQHNFSPRSELKHDGKQFLIVKPDPRYIVINGEPVPDMYHFYGLSNAESVAVLTPTQAVKIYGNVKGKNGAVQIKGSAIKYVGELVGLPFPPSKISLVLDRSKGDFMVIPNTENELKTLTVYNSKGKVIYNSTNYEDNWNGESGNYKEFANKKITPNTYTFLVKIDGKSRENKRGQVTIK